jgi:Uma2 family endonuclease
MMAATMFPPPTAGPPAPTGELPFGGLTGLRRLTVAEYHVLVRAGAFDAGGRVELLNGLLVTPKPRGPAHDNAVYLLARRLDRMAPDGWVVRSQSGATLSDDTEPEPDVLIARGGEHTFASRHPTPADAALVVEVADSSLRRDRREELAIYAAAGVPEYWVVNVPDRQVEVYTRPAGDFYDTLAVYGPGRAVPVVLDGTAVGEIAVADLFPAPGPA